MRYPVRSPSFGVISVETKRPCTSGSNNAMGFNCHGAQIEKIPGFFLSCRSVVSCNAPKQKLNVKQEPFNIPIMCRSFGASRVLQVTKSAMA